MFSTYSDDRISSKFKNMIEKIDNIRVFEHPPISCEDAVDELFQPTQMTLASRISVKIYNIHSYLCNMQVSWKKNQSL